MDSVAVWISLGVSCLGLSVGYVTYRVQRARRRIAFAVVSNQGLLVRERPDQIEIRWSGRLVKDLHVVVVRVVNVGDRAIVSADFASDLALIIHGPPVLHAQVSSSRPDGLALELATGESEVHISPFLFNAGDMFEIKLLCEGKPAKVSLNGRIRDLAPMVQRPLPYPPGSGPEGDMLPFDKFMWSVPVATIYLAIMFQAITAALPASQKIAVVGIVSLVFLVLYPILVYRLVQRRRLWRG